MTLKPIDPSWRRGFGRDGLDSEIFKMSDGMIKDEQNGKPTCTFFKKANRNRNVRKRKVERSDSEDDEETAIVRKEKKTISNNPMFQKTDGFDSKSIREITDKDIDISFKSTRSAMRAGPEDLGATSIVEIDTEFDRDAQALFEKSLKADKERKEEDKDSKRYRGLNNYMTFYEKKGTAQGNASSGMVRYCFVTFSHLVAKVYKQHNTLCFCIYPTMQQVLHKNYYLVITVINKQ